MDFTETDEHRALREAVSRLAGDYGHSYWVHKAKTGERTTELWTDAGKAGYLGVAIPEEYGGGGGGIVELSVVGEELAAGGCPLLLLVVSPAHRAVPLRHRRAEAGVATRTRRRLDDDLVRDHRAGRWHQLTQDHDHGAPRRRGLAAVRYQVLHLRGGPVRRNTGGGPPTSPSTRWASPAPTESADVYTLRRYSRAATLPGGS